MRARDNNIIKMGNKQQRQKLSSKDRETSASAELAGTYSGEQSTWQQYVEIHQCCGIKVEKIKRKKLIWQNNFIENCKLLADEFAWPKDMIDLVSNCQLAKTRYFNEVNLLKNDAIVEEPTVTEVLHTPAEVEQFKTNLKRSVIMSFVSSKPSDSSSMKIASMIETRSNRGKIEIERTSYLNRQSNKNINQYAKTMSVASKCSFRRSIISLIDDTISSVMGNEKEISKQAARDLEIFLKFSMILERHLGDVDCMLGRIKRFFLVYMEKTYRDTIAASLKIGDYIDNVKQFLVVLREAVVDYYNLPSFSDTQQANLFIANDQNILSACTAILFKDPVFYSQTFAIVNHYCQAREMRFSLILDHLKGSPPDKFLVKNRFCLNAKTIETYINSLSSQNEASMVESIQFKDMVIENSQPYKICMNQLRDLQKTKSPISKMKAIVACSQSITNQIQRFYQRNGLRKQKWMLDADQVLSIFCYILVGARVQNLLSHLFILQNFATSHQLISMSGYYLSVINCAVQQLEGEYQHQIHTEGL